MEGLQKEPSRQETQNPSLEVGGKVFRPGDPVAVGRTGGAFEAGAGWKLYEIDWNTKQVTLTRPHPEKPGKLEAVRDSIAVFQSWQERAQREAVESAKPLATPPAPPASRREINTADRPDELRKDLLEGLDEQKNQPFRGWKG